MNGAALNVDGSLKDLQVVPLKQLTASIIILVPAWHHCRQTQLLL